MLELLFGLAVLLSFLFGWNNSSFLLGNLRGSGVLSFRAAISISVCGLLAGSILEGPKMASSLVGSLAPASQTSILLATVVTSIALTLVLTLVDLPVSFSMIMAAAFLGGTISATLPIHAIRSAEVVVFWFVAPIIAAAIAFAIYNIVVRITPRFGLLTVDSLNRLGAVLTSLAVAYVLGANNLGLIYGSIGDGLSGLQVEGAAAIFAVAAIAGILLLGRGNVSGTLGDKLMSLSPQGVFSAFLASSAVVWAATELAVPLSMGQCLLGGMIGAAFTKNVAVLNGKLIRETVSSWVLAPMAAFLIGYVLVAA